MAITYYNHEIFLSSLQVQYLVNINKFKTITFLYNLTLQ